MTNYKNIFGKPVKFLSTDPDNSEAEGQIWYNSTSGSFKSVVVGEAWSSGGNLITARNSIVGAGSQTAAIGFSGSTSTSSPYSISNTTEEYNGSGWATGGNLNTTRVFGSGTGSQTASVSFGGGTSGSPPYGPFLNTTEEYDGSTWTNVPGTLATARNLLSGAGIQTAALAITGYNGTVVNNVEEYDGTSWTAGGSVGSTRYNVGAAGTLTAGLAFGGSGNSSATEEYDGSAWTNGGSLNTGRNNLKGSGLQTAALAFGGQPPVTGATESYDGSTWTTSPATLATARYSLGSSVNGTNSASLAFGGRTSPANQSATEEYNKSINAITAAAWSSGGNMGTARSRGTGGGTTNAGIFANGQNVNVEEYNGTSWSEQNNMPTALRDPSGFGTQTAFVGCAGYATGPGNVAATHEYDGTNWTTSGNMNTARSSAAPIAAGIITAGLVAQNEAPPYKTVESYNGSTWTTESSVANGRSRGNMTGTESAAFVVNGYGVDPGSPQPGASTTTTENYNGSTWTAGTSSLQGTSASLGMANGNQDNTTIAGGFDQIPFVKLSFVQHYDGTAWSTQPNLGTARYAGIGGGTPSGGFVAGGNATGNTAATEEFNPESTALNIKTLTSS